MLIRRAGLHEVPVRTYWGAEEDEPPQDPPQQDPPATETQPETFPADYVEKLRQEAAANRVKGKEEKERADKLEKELQKIREAEMSELEKAQSELETQTSRAAAAETMAQRLAVTLSVEREANALNFRDPSDAESMLGNIDLDDDGLPDSKLIKEQLKKLAKQKPYLLKESDPGDGDGGPKDPASPKDRFTEIKDKEAQRLRDSGYIPIPTR